MRQRLRVLTLPTTTSEMDVPPNCSIIGVVPDYDDDNGGLIFRLFLAEDIIEEKKPAPRKRAAKKAAPKNEPTG